MPRYRLIPEPSITSEAAKQNFSVALKQQKRFSSLEDMHKWALFNLGNTHTGYDGRTYVYLDKNGTYISRFVSQYSKIIYDNVEPKIKPIIQALHRQGYLTFGSCQGHPEEGDWRRWFGVCFASEEGREQFIHHLKSFKLPLTYWKEVAIPSAKAEDGLRMNVTYRQPIEGETFFHTEEELTKYWNSMFRRSYDRYFPLAVGICADLSGRKNFFVDTRLALSRWRIEKITATLASKIAELPAYFDF